VNPKITIITPTVNISHYVDDAIGSVHRSECVDGEIEHIVVHDGTSDFVKRLSAKYPWLHVIQGPGRGATAAVAVALAAASGDFVIFLNSDDRMHTGSIAALLQAAAARPDIEVWTGGTRIFEAASDENERTVRLLDRPEMTALTLSNVLDDLPLMTARFVRRSVYDRIGPIDEHFSACSDREFAIRMVLAGVHEAPLGVLVSELRLHGESRTIRNPSKSVPAYLDEHLEIARRRMMQQGLSDAVRSTFRGWHARETVRKAYYELRAAQFAAAGQTLQSAFAFDHRWPWQARSLIRGRRLRRR
jgi:glycosyltransferase involved in cell wall biosynthesis